MRKPNQGTKPQTSLGGSFRDPAGFVFRSKTGILLRQVNPAGAADFDLFMQSGLYGALVKKGWLVSHVNASSTMAATKDAHAVIKPEVVPCISYPFEWSFSQLQDAALLTLSIQKLALKHGMVLKDASAYNVQFLGGKPVFIDTLSFEKYEPGTPWQAYRQFCQHFLAPLALMAYVDTNLSQLLRVHLDGVPLPLAARLLPRRARLRPGLAMHIVLHGRAQKAKESEHRKARRPLSMNGLVGILESLQRTTRNLHMPKRSSEWGDYYLNNTNYTASAADQKAKTLAKLANRLGAKTALDLGGNNGQYSRVLTAAGVRTICTDIDPNAVEANYQFVRKNGETGMLPLLVDLTNPGGGLGWNNRERETIQERLNSDLVMALALVHHLAISNNLPFRNIAECFAGFGRHLIIEFVPKSDSQVQKLLSTRKDIFPEYNEEGFVHAFSEFYALRKEAKISGTKRTLYLFERK
jgi:ribosomal protein L11 methylase PrmA